MSSPNGWGGVLGRAVEKSRFGLVLLDADGVVARANAAACELLGATEAALIGRSIAELVHRDDRGWMQPELEALYAGAVDRIRREVRFMAGDDEIVWAELNIHLVEIDGVVCAVGMLEDARDRVAREHELQRLAETDPLTELYNRRRFTAELQRHLEQRRRYGPAGALLLIDIDGLKRINDERGHLAGDRAIVSLAEILRNNLRASDVVARIGGDEFAVLLPTASADQARTVADLILVAGRRHPFNQGCVTASIGIAAIGALTLQPTALFESADAAMYEVKRAGGDACGVTAQRLSVMASRS